MSHSQFCQILTAWLTRTSGRTRAWASFVHLAPTRTCTLPSMLCPRAAPRVRMDGREARAPPHMHTLPPLRLAPSS
jgi:hypothetical protein